MQKEAQKRQKKRDKKSNSSRATLEGEEMMEEERDREILEAEDLQKPEKPVKPEEQNLKELIRSKYEEIRRKPGEPKVSDSKILSKQAYLGIWYLRPREDSLGRPTSENPAK